MKTIPPMMMKRKARLNMTSKIFSNLKKASLKYYSLSLMGGKKISKGHSEKNLASI